MNMKKFCIVFGIVLFVMGVINIFHPYLGISIIATFIGVVFCTIGISFISAGFKIKTNYNSASKQYSNLNTVNKSKEINQPKPIISTINEERENKIIVSPDSLDFDSVINRYLSNAHSSVPSMYSYYDYLYAEFDCMLNGLKKAEIQIEPDFKVYRNKAILTPFEKTKNITVNTPFNKLKNFVAIDVETTGLKTGYNDIIEVSAIKFIDFKPSEIFSTLLKPRKPIPPEATKINGITDDMVKDSPTFSQIYNSLKSFIGDNNLVAHNAAFDIKFLYVSGLDIDDKKQTIYDTLQLSKWAIKDWDDSPLESYKLTDICNEVGIYFNGAHRSSADALAAGLLFLEIVKIKKSTYDLTELT